MLNVTDVNEWFCSLPVGRQKVLREDKWMFANAAFKAGREASVQNTDVDFQQWFDSLSAERQKILREDKWMLASAAFDAGLCIQKFQSNDGIVVQASD